MGKKSKENSKKLKKLEKARLFHQSFNNDASTNSGGSLIDQDVTKIQGKETIPSLVAENPNILEPAEEILAINFRPRSLDHEQIDRMNNIDARALVHKIFCANKMNKSEARSN
ncbi:MAG: hypothetical protein Q8R55_08110, partial [Candidatus Taylorbacteria bacterium]|nr:hypothetical protein [Candidatus Taylorbacteria bacterium]